MAPDPLPRKKPGLPNGLGQRSADRVPEHGNRHGCVVPRLLKNPNVDHHPDSYDNVENLEYPPAMYSAMERYLPPDLLGAPRSRKLAVLQQILSKYRPSGERSRVRETDRGRILRQ